MDSTPLKRSLRIGVDVGGTNTDAVILDINADAPNRGVIACHKTTTTSPNVTDGIEAAVRTVLEQAGNPHSEVACLVIGTTHFINAIVEHDTRRLSKVAIIRLSKSFTKEIPPFSDFPPHLKKILNGYYGYVDGGLHIDGSQEAPIVDEQVIGQCRNIRSLGLKAVVISGVFSPIDKHFRQEDQVKQIIQRELPDSDIVCSSDVSNIGFLERENAAILNASILSFARRTVRGFKAAMTRLDLKCALFLSQNDGTLIDADAAASLPIRTFSSGPTNSMRGAAYLGLAQSGREIEARTATIVVDVGGTTTDVGVLLPSGFPRQASAYVTVAGVRINFAMPHIESIGLGGGSIVRETARGITVGPDSVGHELNPHARIFGGSVLTTTDIAVAAGEEIGNPSLVQDIGGEIVKKTRDRIKYMLGSAIDLMKMSPDPLPVLLVGGGSIICPTDIQGTSKLIIPPFHSVANAVGAAISKVGGSVDMIQNTSKMSTSEAVDQAKKMAIEKAIKAGAKEETVTIAEVEAIPLQYVADQLRVIVRAIGELSDGTLEGGQIGMEENEAEEQPPEEKQKVEHSPSEDCVAIEIAKYRPKVIKNARTGIPEWHVSEVDVEWMRDGCYVLGCAGGGSPMGPYIRLRDELRAGNTVRVIDSSSLSEDALIYCKQLS